MLTRAPRSPPAAPHEQQQQQILCCPLTRHSSKPALPAAARFRRTDDDYLILDDNGDVFGVAADNPRICPSSVVSDNNPVTNVDFQDKTTAQWTWNYDANAPVWGFKASGRWVCALGCPDTRGHALGFSGCASTGSSLSFNCPLCIAGRPQWLAAARALLDGTVPLTACR